MKRPRELIADHNPSAAARIATELVDKISLLPEFPELGVPVGSAPVPTSVRDMVFGKYLVRYSVHSAERFSFFREIRKINGREFRPGRLGPGHDPVLQQMEKRDSQTPL